MAEDKHPQLTLIDIPESWREVWKGMPEYNHKNLMPAYSIQVHFRNLADRQSFSKLVGQKITDLTQSIWHPQAEIVSYANKRWIADKGITPKYPVYIISKGRWESRMTSKALEEMNVPYHIVVEPQEYDRYASVIDKEKIFVLPFSNLGLGSIPARNWVWDHAVSIGAERHWIIDDNITKFVRYNNNLKVQVTSGVFFRVLEDFTDRYENVAISGPNYWMFVPRKDGTKPPIYLNTRVYSCLLIRNDLKEKDGRPYRWRGRYNEDTDLCLRLLKDGWCTILFNAFIADKVATMSMKGGNTDELYKDDGRRKMAQSLVDQHPDVTTITWKWGRWQHQVNYEPFKKNKLILKKDVVIDDIENEYGMTLQITEDSYNPIEEEENEVVEEQAICEDKGDESFD